MRLEMLWRRQLERKGLLAGGSPVIEGDTSEGPWPVGNLRYGTDSPEGLQPRVTQVKGKEQQRQISKKHVGPERKQYTQHGRQKPNREYFVRDTLSTLCWLTWIRRPSPLVTIHTVNPTQYKIVCTHHLENYIIHCKSYSYISNGIIHLCNYILWESGKLSFRLLMPEVSMGGAGAEKKSKSFGHMGLLKEAS